MDSKKVSKFLSESECKKIIKRFNDLAVPVNNVNVAFAFKLNKSMVTIYKTGTLLIQGNDALQTEQLLFASQKTKIADHKVKDAGFKTAKVLPKLTQYEIGSDEVGVGDYFGGVVVCAALVNQNQIKQLKALGIADSKKLDDREIVRLASILKQQIEYVISSANPSQYNALFDRYQNAHIIKTFLHNDALVKLVQKNKLNQDDYTIIMDQFASPKNYYIYLNQLEVNQTIRINKFETKAEDKYVCVAAASIIARDYWLNQMDLLQQQIKLPVYFGASNKKILDVAKKLYLSGGMQALNDAVKLHFSFTQRIVKK